MNHRPLGYEPKGSMLSPVDSVILPRFQPRTISESARILHASCTWIRNLSNATFTFRIPDELAGHLCSAQMSSWLADFLRHPSSLPQDPGSGEKRISLSLPKDLVLDASKRVGCSHSETLRRIAVKELGLFSVPLPSPAGTATTASIYSHRFPGHNAGATPPEELRCVPATGASSVIALVMVFVPLMVLLAWIFCERCANYR